MDNHVYMSCIDDRSCVCNQCCMDNQSCLDNEDQAPTSILRINSVHIRTKDLALLY